MLSATTKGRIGELIAAAAIEACGWTTIIAPMDNIDLVATRGHKFLRIQVKSSSVPVISFRCVNPRYKFSTTVGSGGYIQGAHVDIVALVALDHRSVHFVPAANITKSLAIEPAVLRNIDNERASWDKSVATVLV